MKSAILITGGAGYIGSHTALLMAQKGHHVIILDTFVHNQSFNPSWATVIKKDVADKETLHEIFSSHKIEAVMHFAANIEVGRSVRQPLLFYDTNVVKTIALLELMLEHNVKKFIFSSSCAIYGIPQALPLTESHPKNPISPYGRTKLMIETVLEDMAMAYDMQYVALRYFNAAGTLPGHNLHEQHEPETHIIPLLVRAARHEQPFYIFGTSYPTPDGTCIRDYLHVWDIAQAHAAALDYVNTDLPSASFNLGTGTGYSVKQIADEVQKITRKRAKIIEGVQRPGDPAILVADPSHAYSVLKWQPMHSNLDYILQTACLE